MKEYYFDKKLNIITDSISNNYSRNDYVVISPGNDNSIFLDTFQINNSDSVIDFAYSSANISNYEQLLSYHLSKHNIEVKNVSLIRRCYPKDQLTALLKAYGYSTAS